MAARSADENARICAGAHGRFKWLQQRAYTDFQRQCTSADAAVRSAHDAGHEIVGGPSSAGVFSLAPEAGATSVTTAQTVSLLRSHAGVRFAEPTHGGTERP